MGKLKRKDWQYKSIYDPNVVKEDIDNRKLALENAIYLANYHLSKKKEAIREIATNKAIVEVTDQMENQYTDWDLGCAALVLYRRYGKDAQECAEFLSDIQELTREFASSGMNAEAIWDVVRDEIGLDISRDY